MDDVLDEGYGLEENLAITLILDTLEGEDKERFIKELKQENKKEYEAYLKLMKDIEDV